MNKVALAIPAKVSNPGQSYASERSSHSYVLLLTGNFPLNDDMHPHHDIHKAAGIGCEAVQF